MDLRLAIVTVGRFIEVTGLLVILALSSRLASTLTGQSKEFSIAIVAVSSITLFMRFSTVVIGFERVNYGPYDFLEGVQLELQSAPSYKDRRRREEA